MDSIDPMLFWNIILTMVVVPFGWAFNKMFQEVNMHNLMDALKRLEDKLDKILMGSR
jgi:hypothetical protein